MPQPSVIATLATGTVKSDLGLFLFTLSLWNTSPPTVYLLCDQAIADAVSSFHYPGKIVTRVGLDAYSGLTRAQMERIPGVYKNLFFDLCVEKTNVMKWVFETAPNISETGVLYCDCDICFLAPLLDIPETATLAVSHHQIRPQDEALYGKYNGGVLWAKTVQSIHTWIDACKTSRFVDQAAIEDLVTATDPATTYQIPRIQNYGWWRMFQGTRPAADLQAEWSMNRNKAAGGSGILVNGEPLGSIHTHFGETRDLVTNAFNVWVLGWLRKLAVGHAPARRMVAYIEKNFPNHRKI
jgi:hypothetical protein